MMEMILSNEKLLHSEGRDLRRALFSLKQIFQDDKDLVHEFVQNDGLACLIKVGSEVDQNYQNYILRALGQVMLYVDGMNGVIAHNETIQWLYSLIASKFRLVVKTALKLLLVFVEYTESNCLLLINAVNGVDSTRGLKSWSNIMTMLNERDSVDMELLIFAMTLINKMLNGVPDQDTFYDVVDSLEEQGMERIVQRYMSKQGSDLDLLQQFQIYEAVLKREDGDEEGPNVSLDPNYSRQVPRSRKSIDDNDRRKSRRHSLGNMIITPPSRPLMVNQLPVTIEETRNKWSRDVKQTNELVKSTNEFKVNGNHNELNGHEKHNELNGMTPALRKRRERDARHRSFIKEQEETVLTPEQQQTGEIHNDKQPIDKQRVYIEDENRKNREISKLPCRIIDEKPKLENEFETNGKSNRDSVSSTNKKSWMLSMMYSKSQDEESRKFNDGPVAVDINYLDDGRSTINGVNSNGGCNPQSRIISQLERLDLKKENSVKDIQRRFCRSESSVTSPTVENGNNNRIGDFSGIVNKVKEGLNNRVTAASLPVNRVELKCVNGGGVVVPESKKPDNDLQWEQLMKTLNRPLLIKDLDFTDLNREDDEDVFNGSMGNGNVHTVPSPPLVPFQNGSHPSPPPPPPPLIPSHGMPPPPPPPLINLSNGRSSNVPPPPPPTFLNKSGPPLPPSMLSNGNGSQQSTAKVIKKNKKTVKLFWKEVRDDQPSHKIKLIWNDLAVVNVDTQKLEHLFENRAKDLVTKKQHEINRSKGIIVLDTKRSNAINIGMTKLPPPRTIKTAILKMDSTIMNREGIEKLLTTMMPTDEEKAKILEAQMANPDVPLGTAEQFLLTLASISELPARLKLWAFKLDYDVMEREVAEPLMDLKQGINDLKRSKTFKCILATLLSIGNFLNGVEAKGFQIDYLAKVPEVKDTVHKHSLLHHLCHMVMEKFPDTTDLYSEIGAISRSAKYDFDELSVNLLKMETECKASWDHLKAIAKHDGSSNMKTKMSEFLAECAEQIIVLGVVHRRVLNRFTKFLLYLGIPANVARDMKINQFLKTISEFALEYRTTRERVLQQFEKKASHRERNKTRGKLIIDMDKFKSKETQAEEELKQVLGSSVSDSDECKWGTIPGVRNRLRKQEVVVKRPPVIRNCPVKDECHSDAMTEGDDEILESLVKTATAPTSRTTMRERKRARQADRKSLRRTLKNGLSDEEKKFLATISPKN
ncbi:hypothetical protein CHUAL_012029 [Chamberlinius hualienensis]